MIADRKLHKLRTVVEPSKSLKAMTKRRNKKGGAMFLAGGGIDDIDITALNKNILSLLFKDVFIPLMQKFKIDTTSTKFKMMTPIIINVLKLTVDKASNIQDLIKLLSDNFLNIIFRFIKPNENGDNIKDNLKVILTKYLIDKSKSIVKDDTQSGGSMYLAGGGKYSNWWGGGLLDTIDQFIDTKDKTAGQAMADTYKALFTKLISFLPGGDMLNITSRKKWIDSG